MQTKVATLHAGLLARKGEARPCNQAQAVLADIRRRPVAVRSADDREHHDTGRQIELPRSLARAAAPRHAPRRQVPTRVEAELHLRMKITVARSGRTQQDLVAAALGAYLDFLNEDVLPMRRDRTCTRA